MIVLVLARVLSPYWGGIDFGGFRPLILKYIEVIDETILGFCT